MRRQFLVHIWRVIHWSTFKFPHFTSRSLGVVLAVYNITDFNKYDSIAIDPSLSDKSGMYLKFYILQNLHL